MSWAKLAAKNPSNIDNPEGKEPQYAPTKWTNVFTPISFPLISEIANIVKGFLNQDTTTIVVEYVAFSHGLTWCNLNVCHQERKDPRNRWYATHSFDIGKCSVSDLPGRFGIDPVKHKYLCGFKVCQIIFLCEYIPTTNNKYIIKHINTILFANTLNDIKTGSDYTIQLEFFGSHIQSLVKINSCDKFVAFLEQICETNPKLNQHTMTHDNKKQKIEQLWDIWKHIFGPKIVFDNLKKLTEY